MKNSKPKLLVFDLDDTLYKEIDFVKSGYESIIQNLMLPENTIDNMMGWYFQGLNVFELLIINFNLSVDTENLLDLYRNHYPSLQLPASSKKVLNYFRISNQPMSLITDGRSKTQRNKLKSLGILDFFDKIIISDEIGSNKPSIQNYKAVMSLEYRDYVYIADNTAKDFITPSQLKWDTFCLLDNGLNIHKQDLNQLPNETIKIDCLENLI